MSAPSTRQSASATLDLRLAPAAVGAWLVTVVGVVAPVSVTASVAIAGSLAVPAMVAWMRRRTPAPAVPVLIGVFGLVAGFGWALVLRQHQIAVNPLADKAVQGSKVTVGLTVTDDPRAIARTDRVVVAVRVSSVRREDVANAAATVLAPAEGWADLVPGQHVSAVVKVSEPRRPDLTVATLTASGAPSRVRAPPWYQQAATSVRSQFQQVSSRGLSAPESGLLPGLVLGDISALGDDLKDDFRACGLSHLTAVSGDTT